MVECKSGIRVKKIEAQKNFWATLAVFDDIAIRYNNQIKTANVVQKLSGDSSS